MSDTQSLALKCSAEQKRYLRREIAHASSCYELFRLSLVFDDQDAWECLYQQFIGLVQAAVHRARVKLDSSGYCEKDNRELAEDAFVTMRKLITPQTFIQYRSLGALLSHLKQNAMYALLDCRSLRNPFAAAVEFHESTIEYSSRELEDRALKGVYIEGLKRLINGRIRNEKERNVFVRSVEYGMTPREILEAHPETFSSIDEVYRTKGNLLERLTRDPAIRSYLQMD